MIVENKRENPFRYCCDGSFCDKEPQPRFLQAINMGYESGATLCQTCLLAYADQLTKKDGGFMFDWPGGKATEP